MFKIKKSAVFLIIISYSAAFLYGGSIPYLIFYIIFSSFFVSFIWVLYVKNKIYGYQSFDSGDYYVDDLIEIKSVIDNDTLFPVPHIEVFDNTAVKVSDESPKIFVLSLMPLEREFTSQVIKLKYRGIFEVGPIEIRVKDVFNVFTWNSKIYSKTILKVYPRIHRLDYFKLKSIQTYGALNTRQNAYEDNTSISDIKKYSEGDNFNRIHWKISAKKGSLHVKNYEMTGSASAYIFLDFNKSSFTKGDIRMLEEKAIEVVSSIAAYLLSNAVSINLYVNSSSIYFTSGRDTKYLKNFLDILCQIKADGEMEMGDLIKKRIKFISKGSSIIVVGGDLISRDIDTYCSIKEIGYDLILIYVSDYKIDDELINKTKTYNIGLYKMDSKSDIKGVLESI